jgi:DNA repair exonuclease SbcCD ATPase subunit
MLKDLGVISNIPTLFSAIASSVSPATIAIGGFVAAVGAVAAVTGVIDHFTESWDEAKEKADKSRSNYEDTKDQLEKVNEEYETMQSRIKELEARNGALKPMEQAELDKLKLASEELERQKGLLEDLSKQQGLKAAADSANLLEKGGLRFDTYKKEMKYDSFGGEMGEFMTQQTGTIIDRYTTAKNAIKDLEKEQKEVQERLLKYSEEDKAPSLFGGLFGKSDYEKDKAQLDDIEERLSNARQQVIDDGKIINENYQSLFDENGGIYKGYEGLVDNIRQALFSTPEEIAAQAQKAFDEVINSSSKFRSQFQGLVSQAKEKGGISAEDITSDYQELLDALGEGGLDDLVLQVNAEAEIKNIDALKGDLEEALNSDIEALKLKPDIEIDESSLEEKKDAIIKAFGELSSEEQTKFLDNIQNVDWSSWELGDIPDEVRDLANATEELSGEAEELSGTFGDMDTLFGDDAEFGGKVDNYVQQLDTLKQALEQFNKGELTESDMFDLQKQFGELLGDANFENFGDALSDAIGNILGTTSDAADGLKEFGDAAEDVGSESEEAANLIELFDQQIQAVGSNSQLGQWLEEYKQHFIEFYTEVKTAQETLDEFSNYQSMLSGAKSSAYGAGGLSTEQIENLKKAYKGFDITGLFVDSTQGVTLNNKILDELNKKVEEETLANLYSQLETKQAEYQQAKSQNVDTSAIEEEISLTQQLITQYEGMTSAYSQWVNSQSGSNQRDMYSSIGSGYDSMKKILDAGWYNDESINKYLDTVLDKSARTGDALQDFARITQEIQGTGYSIKDFWQYDDSGTLQTDGLYNFLNVVRELHPELVSLGQDGAESFDLTGAAIEQLAADTGMSVESIEALVRALTEAEKDWEIKTDVDTSGVEEGESQIDSLRDKIEGNPIVQTIKSKFEGVVEKGKQVFGNLFGGLFGGGSEEEGETQTVKVKQEPDPLELKVTVPGAEGEGSDQTFTVHVKADYGEGGDALQINIEPTGEGLDENGAYTLQTALAGVAEDGTFKLSVPSPDGVEGNTYTLHTAVDKNGNLSIILHEPDGVEGHKYTLDTEISGKAKDGSFTFTLDEPDGVDNGVYKIKVEPADDGKVVVTAVDANGNEAISMPIDPDLEAFGTAIADLRSQLESDPIKIPVEVQNNEPGAKDSYDTQQKINSGWKNGGQSPTGRENIVEDGLPTYLQNLTVEGKVVINEVEDQTGGSASVDGTLNATNVNDETGGSANVEGTVNATNVDTSNVETPTIEANVTATGEVSGTANANADNSGVQQAVAEATSLVEGMNDVTGTAHIEADNSALQSAVQESDIKIKSVNSMTGEGKIKANDSDLVSKVQSSEQKLSSLSAKSAEPTIRAIDNASTVIHHVIGELNNIPRNVESTITTTHVNKNVTINETSKASGTLTTAHATGTAYNVINYRPAYKDGKIALSKDEQALVNELGIGK